jgi:tripartite-type tricarboxylate transporter receptor subunit TctC
MIILSIRAVAPVISCLGLLFSASAHSQSYPAKPIRFVVGFAPGGGTDILARAVGQKLSEAVGQQVVVDNRPGANGNIASELVARAPADGYTMLMVAASHAVNASIYRKLPYDTIKDFAPVIAVGSVPLILNVHPSLPVRSVKDMIALARSKPGELTFSSGGSGSAEHVAGEMFKHLTSIKITHVPYKGAGASLIDLMAGQISMGFNTMPSVISYIKAGRLHPLANTDRQRSAVLPEVPTMAEAGVRGFELTSWYGVLVPAATPKDIVVRLNTEIAKVLGMKDVRERLAALGAQPIGGSPEQFGAFIASEVAKFAKVATAANIQVD